MLPAGIVIIGAGQAGAWAARTLRDLGYTDALYLIGQESYVPYERPELSKGLLIGEIAESDITILTDDELASMSFYQGIAVSQIDKKAKQVVLTDGLIINYTKLLIATGGRASVPPILGVDLSCVYLLRDLTDAWRLSKQLQVNTVQRIAIIGGGWIGLELASTCSKMGHQVTIFEAGERLCQRSVDVVISKTRAVA